MSHSGSAPLLDVERVQLASRSSSPSAASAGNFNDRDSSSSRPFLHSNSHHRANEQRSSLPTWRQQYSLADEDYVDYDTSLFARPLRRLTWKETGHLLLVNTAMFWPDYLYPRKDRKKVTPERRRRLLFSYAPGEFCPVSSSLHDRRV